MTNKLMIEMAIKEGFADAAVVNTTDIVLSFISSIL